MLLWATSFILWLFNQCQVNSQHLLSIQEEDKSKGSNRFCSQKNTVSCVKADINMTVLLYEDIIEIPDGVVLSLLWRNKNSAVFKNGTNEAAFTWNSVHVAGQVHANSRAWSLQGCGDGCYLWIRQSNSWPDEKSEHSQMPDLKNKTEVEHMEKLLTQGLRDSTSIVTYSIMIWYTPQFRALFPSQLDMELFVDLIFIETNQGYINSQMPVRAVKHCAKQHPQLTDMSGSSSMLSAFSNSMSQTNLRHSADVAALLVADMSGCGIAYLGQASRCGATFSVTEKSCATGYFTFAHEIGHNFGASHNPEEFSTSQLSNHPYPYGHAHWILPSGSRGVRTILAYSDSGHPRRVNYYSNPDVRFPSTGTQTGVAGVSNNARVITENRFLMAGCGNEQNTCFASSGSGTGSSSDWSFCTRNVCTRGQGDCDTDSECSGSLVCGSDNCKDFNPNAESEADCCIGIVFITFLFLCF